MRVLGSNAAYTKYGLDVQEAALRAGARPGPGWGEELPEHWGRLGTDDDGQSGGHRGRRNYPEFYRRLERALRQGVSAAGPPRRCRAVARRDRSGPEIRPPNAA